MGARAQFIELDLITRKKFPSGGNVFSFLLIRLKRRGEVVPGANILLGQQ